MARKTSLYSAHQKLKSVRSKRTGYRRKRMDLAKDRAITEIKGEAQRAALGEVVSGIQSIATMADEWKQQREIDDYKHQAFSEMEGITATPKSEQKGFKKFFGPKHEYSRDGKVLSSLDQMEALAQHSTGEGKYWDKQKGQTEAKVPDAGVTNSIDEFEAKEVKGEKGESMYQANQRFLKGGGEVGAAFEWEGKQYKSWEDKPEEEKFDPAALAAQFGGAEYGGGFESGAYGEPERENPLLDFQKHRKSGL